MSLEVYRIDNSLFGKWFRRIRKSDLPTHRIIGGAAMVGSLNCIRVMGDFFIGNNYYLLDKKHELNRFINPLGNSWIEKTQYYIRHPKAVKDRELIESQYFQEYILREQISDIVSFLRANIQIKELYIKSLNQTSFNFGVNVPIEQMTVEGNVNIDKFTEYELKITSKSKLKISEKRTNYTWINDFSTLKTAIDNFDGGKFEERLIIDNSFVFSLKEANRIGMNTNLMGRKEFIINFEAE